MINYKHPIVQKDLKQIVNSINTWDFIENKTILVTGATGMLASYFSFILFYLNENHNANIKIILLARNKENVEKVYGKQAQNSTLLIQDVCDKIGYTSKIDFIFHAAGSASPYHILNNPTGIIKANTLGTINILETALKAGKPAVIFTSTREVYGKLTDVESASENDMGTLNPLNSRSCYPESKRMAETLLKSYADQFSVPFINLRIAHTFGPGMQIKDDGRVMADFLNNAINKEDILLKSEGLAERAFCYISDALIAIFILMKNEVQNEAINIANETEPIKIIDLAKLIQKCTGNGKGVTKEIASTSKKAYTNYKRTPLNTKKLESYGWQPLISLEEGIQRTLKSVRK